MSRYARVVVDLAAGDLDRMFTYRIPPELEEQTDIGSLVEIPFGKGNRILQGYVVELSDETDFDANRIKDIAGIASDTLSVEQRQIRLAWQIRRAYGGTMLQALKTVLPVRKQVRAVVETVYVPAVSPEAMAAYRDALAGSDRFAARYHLMNVVIRAQETGEPLTRSWLLGTQGVSVTALRKVAADGILSTEEHRKYRDPSLPGMQQSSAADLNPAQQQVADAILSDSEHMVHLIHGVTGSGKTEIYIRLAKHVIAQGGQAIILIPEIALSMQTVGRFRAHFEDRVCVMNSRLSDGERYDQFLKARRGEVDVVVGPRSALFVPFPNLKLIVIDEEHDGAYKSELTPKFHARDVAGWLARMCGATLVLGSATPSVASYARALNGMYRLHTITQRAVAGSVLPSVTIVDLREEFRQKNRSIFSRTLAEKIRQTLDRKEQVMLFLNRRGYAGFVSCRSCGHVFKCRHCELSMTAHRDGTLKCHYCGYEIPVPEVCPECGSPYVAAFGTGTQKVEKLAAEAFPDARILRLDRDTSSGKDAMSEILGRFSRHEADILVGTQMIVKGHDFPKVTLVGILAADLSLFAGDYMASERTFDLITQASGRAGRAARPGEVVIQTYQPEHDAIRFAASADYPSFFQSEIAFRLRMHYPPAVYMLVVLLTGKEEEGVMQTLSEMYARTKAFEREQQMEGIEYVGPAGASLVKVKDAFRQVLYIRSRRVSDLIQIRTFMETLDRKGNSLQFDLDPMSVY